MELAIQVDENEFRRLLDSMTERVKRIGIEEAERRMGFSFDDLIGNMVDVEPSNDGLTIYLRPSEKLRRAAEAVLQSQRAIGMR